MAFPFDIFDIEHTKLMVTLKSLQDLLEVPNTSFALYEAHQYASKTVEQINQCYGIVGEFALGEICWVGTCPWIVLGGTSYHFFSNSIASMLRGLQEPPLWRHPPGCHYLSIFSGSIDIQVLTTRKKLKVSEI
jgi:hypothetical protein